MRNLLKAARRVAAGSQFVGQRFVLNEAIRTRGANGSLVQIHCLRQAALDARNLRADQSRTILEVLRAVRGPAPELSVVRRERLSMLRLRIQAPRAAACRARERSMK